MSWIVRIIIKRFYWLNHKDLVQTAVNITTVSTRCWKIRKKETTSDATFQLYIYYFVIISNYRCKETPVAMSSNSDTEFLVVELDFTFYNVE